MRINAHGAFCDDAQDSYCGFKIWRKIASKKLSDSAIEDLITKGSIKKLKGFKAKSGKSFDASLKVDKEAKKIVFDFS